MSERRAKMGEFDEWGQWQCVEYIYIADDVEVRMLIVYEKYKCDEKECSATWPPRMDMCDAKSLKRILFISRGLCRRDQKYVYLWHR